MGSPRILVGIAQQQHPHRGTIVREVFADAEGRPVDGPEHAATIEVEVRYPDGTVERTYFVRVE